MKYIDAAVLSALNSGQIRPVIILDMNIDGTDYRFADSDVPVTNRTAIGEAGSDIELTDGDIEAIDGDVMTPTAGKPALQWGTDLEVYIPRDIEVEIINYSKSIMVSHLAISIDNVDAYLTSIFLDGTPRDSDVNLYYALYDADIKPLGRMSWFQGTLDSWELDEERIRIEASSIFTRWSQKTLSTHPLSCRWKEFKGTECQYSGSATSCDKSYARCKALNNTINFGGFRFLADIIDKEIWWGREREVTETSRGTPQ